MSRNSWKILTMTAACLALAVGASAGDPTGEYDEQAMMDAWMKSATPGEQHKELANMAGEWKTMSTHYEHGQASEPTEGTATFTMLMGGRVVQGTYGGMMMGQPFEGMSLNGYDNVTQKYWSTWIDSWGTGLFLSHGHKNEDGTFEYSGTMASPMGGEMDMRMVISVDNANQHSMKMYNTYPGTTEEVLGMEIVYTRISS